MKQFILAEVKTAPGDDPNGEFEVILSAPTLDRDDEVIDAFCFEPLPEHITFDIDHGMSTATTVGSGSPRYAEDGRLRVKGTFSSIPRAQEVRTLVNEGHIRTTSVAFMNAKRVKGKDGKTHITNAELLNGAFVPIPSNREAVVLASKGFEEKSTKSDRLQSIHDLAVENGAECGTAKAATGEVVRKGHGLSATNLRTILQDALSAAREHDGCYPWLRDYSDDWVVFEEWDGDRSVVYQQSYVIDGNVASLTGDPIEVLAVVQYEPLTTDSTDAPAAPADDAGKSFGTPADSAGKPPASEVIEVIEVLLLAEASLALHP